MSQHLMTVCVFCLLCATHAPCSAHTDLIEENRLEHFNNGLTDPNRLNKLEDAFILPKDIGNTKIRMKTSSPPPPHYLDIVEYISKNKKKYNSPVNNKQLIRRKRVKKSTELTAGGKILDELYYIRKTFQIYNKTLDTFNWIDFKQLVKRLGLELFYPTPNHNKTCVSGEKIIERLTYHGTNSDAISLNRSGRLQEIVGIERFQQVCPLLLYQLAADTSEERGGCIFEPENILAGGRVMYMHDKHSDVNDNEESSAKMDDYRSTLPTIWLYATISVIIISACGLLGVVIIPFMQNHFYHQLLQFLVALAVGTLCGDALLHLLPHAMMPHKHSHSYSNHHSHSVHKTAATAAAITSATLLSDEDEQHLHNLNIWKGFVAMLGVIFFYFVEKFLTLGAEWRKRRQRKHKLPARVRVMRDNDSAGNNSVGEKLCKHKYSSYPYCYDEIATETQDEHHNRGNNTQCEELDVNSFEKKLNKTDLINNMELKDIKETDKMFGTNNTTIVDVKQSPAAVAAIPPAANDSYTVILREHENTHHGHSHTHGHVHAAPDSLSSVAWMVIMGDGLHNFTDGMAIGAAFASGIAGGFSTSVAVFCHELPHEIGDFAVLLKAGMSAKQAMFYNLLSSVLCFFGCMLGVVIGNIDTASHWVFSAAAGMFIYIALVDMIPELTSSHSNEGGSLLQVFLQFCGLMAGLGAMTLIALYEENIKTMFEDSF